MDKKRAGLGELALNQALSREDDFIPTSPGGGIYEHLPPKPVSVTHDFHSSRQSLSGTRVSRVWRGDVGGGWDGGEDGRVAEAAARLFSSCEQEIPPPGVKSPRRSPPSSPRHSQSSHRTRQVCGNVLA